MNAIIEHRVGVLNPNTLPDYLNQLNMYVLATDPKVHAPDFQLSGNRTFPEYKATWPMLLNGKPKQLFLQEGPIPAGALPEYLIDIDKFNRITNGTALGKALYPNALDLLEKLNIRNVYDLKDLLTNRSIECIYALTDLRNNLDSMCLVPVSFYATINPPVSLGTDLVSIEIDPLADAVIHTYGSGYSFKSQNPRAIKISAQFADPERAASGLKGLSGIFPDTVFTEKLLLNGLPKDVADMYREIAARNLAYSNYIDGLTDEKSDFDESVYREMTSQASISLIGFLKPLIEGLGIRPTRMFYYNERLNMPYNIKVDSLDEVADNIRRGYYDGTRIPVIHAVFNGNKVVIRVPSWKYRVSTPVAMQITNGSGRGTLESILEGMNSIAGK
ncbi:MAG: hypothetical protein AABW61_01900 [Candidatus Aenigmatarchaeota archaeon]